MASSIQQFISIRDVVFLYSEAAKLDDTKFKRLWTIAFRGYLQFGLGHFFATKKELLPVNENKTVTFPDDILQWINIEPVADSFYTSFIRSGKITQDNHYTVDENNRAFVFDMNLSESEVVLEYVYAPEVDEDLSDYVIPVQFTEAMIDFISWQDVKHMPASSHFGRGDKADRASAFRASLQLAQRLYKPFRLSDTNYKDHNRTGYGPLT